ncbi:hypothetical protein HYT25_00360 [Candidatus Pacearchaeota archaeon]|nr:hypothetical protein [Candidatus Pacearchaeota archaeon]
MSFRKFMKYSSEEENLVKTILISLLTSFTLLAFLYFFKLKYIENFIPKYGFFLFFAILSYSLILPSVKHVRIYKEFACMSGMMIGMTIGMISGFLPGLFLASTNGMFVGSVFGMSVGIFFGIWNGKCCGIMGVMEGIMAGFMGGLMGSMTSLMMFNDNLKGIVVISFFISAITLFGLNYMVYNETREIKDKNKEGDFFTMFWSLLLTALTVFIMVFGPRSVLFQ